MTRRSLGRLLVLAGVGVWGVYLAMALLGADPKVAHFLPFHLAGVIPGSILTRWRAS